MTKKTLLKGVLLWMTALSTFCFLAGGCENLVEEKEWLSAILWFVANIGLSYICYTKITYRELYKLSGCMWCDKFLRIIVVLALMASFNSCNYRDEIEEIEEQMAVKAMSSEQMSSLNFIYKMCVETYGDELTSLVKSNPTFDDKINVIRYCDYVLDKSGDFLMEFSEYDDIESILWPNGFGVFD